MGWGGVEKGGGGEYEAAGRVWKDLAREAFSGFPLDYKYLCRAKQLFYEGQSKSKLQTKQCKKIFFLFIFLL